MMKDGLLTPQFDQKDVELLGQTTKHQGFYSLSEHHLRFRKYDGSWSAKITRELFQCRSVCGVLLYDPEREEVVLLEQFRLGAFEGESSPWLIELVAGIIDEGESPEQAACRETQEEAGYEVDKLLPICNYWPSPGGTNEHISLFCARVDASIAGGVFGAPGEEENILVKVVSARTAFEAVSSGLICNAQTIIALQWLQINQDKLHQDWLTKT